MKTANQDSRQTQVPAAIGNLIKKAKSFCEDTMLDPQLTRAMEQVSSHIEQLTPDQRKQLQDIGQIMTAACAKPIKGMDQPGKFELELSKDRLHMLLTVTPPIAGGKPVAATDVIEELRARGIEKGVMLPDIQKALMTARNGQQIDKVVIVRGVPAIPGTDAHLEIFGRTAVNRPVEKIDEKHHLDLESRSVVCVKDDAVAVYHPPRPGKTGFDAAGKVLQPPPVKNIQISPGPNIRQEGNSFFADITGMLQFDGQMLGVRPVLLFPHDVTAEAGPIDFDGEILVQGTVRGGVSMIATGDIAIEGNVEAAKIQSRGGSVKIAQGIVGRGVAVITAAVNISTKFVENATLQADQDIQIENGSMHSYLVAGQNIDMSHGKGQLIGGNTLAGKQVAVRILGTPSALHTEISVGLSSRSMKALSRIDIKRRGILASLDQCTPLIDRIYKMVGDPSKLDKASLQALSNLKQIQFILQLDLQKLDKRKARVMAFAAQDVSGKVDVIEDVQPGVVIHIGNAVLENKQVARRRQFTYDTQTKRIVGKGLK